LSVTEISAGNKETNNSISLSVGGRLFSTIDELLVWSTRHNILYAQG